MPPQRIGPYLVERQIGAGAMGAVFQVLDPRLGARYALKAYLGSHMDDGQLSRFQREVEALAAVSHPNLVRIHSAGDEQGRPWFLMDLVEGEDLYHRLRGQPLPTRDAVAIVRDVARAVAALHAQGIVHRDIKPGNVLVTHEGRPLLTDLGVVRVMDDARTRLTVTGELLGTPAYMAPEQALGLPNVGPPADVWALGMLLYALLSGRPAFKAGTSPIALLQQVAQGQLVPLAESAPDVPRDLAVLVAAALRRSPEDRPTAAAWADALQGWLVGEPPGRELAPPPARGRFWLGVAAGVALALAGGAMWAAHRRATTEPREPLSARAERAIASELDALAAPLGSAAPVASAAPLPALREELRAAAAAAPASEARELRAQLALLTLLEAEQARAAGDAGRAGELLRGVPPDAEVALGSLDLIRDLRAAVGAGLPDGPTSPDGLQTACQRWPGWGALTVRRLRLAVSTGKARAAVPLAVALLRQAGAHGPGAAAALEVVQAAQAWDALAEVEPEGLSEPLATRVALARAQAELPGDPRGAALLLERCQPLPADDEQRRTLEAALEAVIKTTRLSAIGPEAAAHLRPELWAHVARWRLDAAYRVPKERTKQLWDFMFAVVGRPGFEDLEVGRAIVPLAEPERVGAYYSTLMQGVLGNWFTYSEQEQAWGLGLCEEAWTWVQAQPPPREALPDIAEQLGILYGRVKRLDGIQALLDTAPGLADPEDAEDMRVRLLRRLGQTCLGIAPARGLAALDEAIRLRPRVHELRADRAKLREWAGVGPELVLEDLYAWLECAPRESRGAGLLSWITTGKTLVQMEMALARPERAAAGLEQILAPEPGYAHLEALRLLFVMDGLDDARLAGALDGLEARARHDEENINSLNGGFQNTWLRWLKAVQSALPVARARLAAGDRAGLRKALEGAVFVE